MHPLRVGSRGPAEEAGQSGQLFAESAGIDAGIDRRSRQPLQPLPPAIFRLAEAPRGSELEFLAKVVTFENLPTVRPIQNHSGSVYTNEGDGTR